MRRVRIPGRPTRLPGGALALAAGPGRAQYRVRSPCSAPGPVRPLVRAGRAANRDPLLQARAAPRLGTTGGPGRDSDRRGTHPHRSSARWVAAPAADDRGGLALHPDRAVAPGRRGAPRRADPAGDPAPGAADRDRRQFLLAERSPVHAAPDSPDGQPGARTGAGHKPCAPGRPYPTRQASFSEAAATAGAAGGRAARTRARCGADRRSPRGQGARSGHPLGLVVPGSPRAAGLEPCTGISDWRSPARVPGPQALDGAPTWSRRGAPTSQAPDEVQVSRSRSIRPARAHRPRRPRI